MAANYRSDYPATDFDPEYRQYFENFYAISDRSDLPPESYAELFTEKATVIMGLRRVQGRTAITTFRTGMWEKVAARSHHPLKVFPFGPRADEVMLYGTLDYSMKDGREITVEWSARAHLLKEGDAVKMDFYQVYLDSAAMNS